MKWHKGQGNGGGHIFQDEGRVRLENGGTTLYPICSIGTGWDSDEDEANARLIVVAPELLESLKLLTDWMLMHTGIADGTIDMLIQANAVIGKAEGEGI
jgi:hypothetical protein